MKMAELSGKQYDNEEKDVKNNDKAQEKKLKNAKNKNANNKNGEGNSNQDLDALEAVTLGQAKNGGEGGLISAAFTHMRTVSAFSMQHEVGVGILFFSRTFFNSLFFTVYLRSLY